MQRVCADRKLIRRQNLARDIPQQKDGVAGLELKVRVDQVLLGSRKKF